MPRLSSEIYNFAIQPVIHFFAGGLENDEYSIFYPQRDLGNGPSAVQHYSVASSSQSSNADFFYHKRNPLNGLRSAHYHVGLITPSHPMRVILEFDENSGVLGADFLCDRPERGDKRASPRHTERLCIKGRHQLTTNNEAESTTSTLSTSNINTPCCSKTRRRKRQQHHERAKVMTKTVISSSKDQAAKPPKRNNEEGAAAKGKADRHVR